jgi:hypothetical protein
VAETKQAAAEIRDYSREQLARSHDQRDSTAIDAAIHTIAMSNGVGRLINTQLIARALKLTRTASYKSNDFPHMDLSHRHGAMLCQNPKCRKIGVQRCEWPWLSQ